MNEFVKETLEKQMKLLSERSAELPTYSTTTILCSYTEQIINLAKILDPELRSQSYAEALSRLPAATLTMSDLEEIAAARKAKLRREDEAFRQILDECRETTIATLKGAPDGKWIIVDEKPPEAP